LLSAFYQLYSDREPPIHHSVCDELEARTLYLPTEEELRKELGQNMNDAKWHHMPARP